MAAYFEYHVRYADHPSLIGKASSSSSSVAETLENALTRAVKDGIYYLAMYPAVTVEIDEFCEDCCGDGFIATRRARSVKRTKCRKCNGNRGPLRSIAFPLQVSECIAAIDNGTGIKCVQPREQCEAAPQVAMASA